MIKRFMIVSSSFLLFISLTMCLGCRTSLPLENMVGALHGEHMRLGYPELAAIRGQQYFISDASDLDVVEDLFESVALEIALMEPRTLDLWSIGSNFEREIVLDSYPPCPYEEACTPISPDWVLFNIADHHNYLPNLTSSRPEMLRPA